MSASSLRSRQLSAAVHTTVLSALAAAATYIWCVHFVFEVLMGTLKLSTNWGEYTPDLVPFASGVFASLTAGAVGALASEGYSKARPYLLSLAGTALGAMGTAMWWALSVGHAGAIPWNYTFPALMMASAAVATTWCRAVAPELRASRSTLRGEWAWGRVNRVMLAGVWLIGGVLCYPHGAPDLAVGFAASFLVISKGLETSPRTQLKGNWTIFFPACYFLWIASRDLPKILLGERLRGDPFAPHVVHLTFLNGTGLSVIGALVLTIAGAWAVSYASRVLTGRASRTIHSVISDRKGLALLLILPFVFLGNRLQLLPVAGVLLLYSYYVAAAEGSLRPLVKALVIVYSWIPLVGIPQYVLHYVALSRASAVAPPFWAYQVGNSDPFMYRTCLGTTIAVVLPLIYGLILTSKAVTERHYLGLLGVLLVVTLGLTFARGPWIATLIVLCLGAAWIRRHARYRWVPLSLGVGVVAVAVLVQMSGCIHLDRLFGREESSAARVRAAGLAWRILQEHPVFGVPPWEWDREWMAMGNRTHGMGATAVGWLQIPVEGGLLGLGMLILFLSALGRKISLAIRRPEHQMDELLRKCMALSIVVLAVCTCFEVTMAEEGIYLAPVLLGLLLGSVRARCHSFEPTALLAVSTSIG